MARQTASARPSTPGKGKKAGAPLVSKRAARAKAKPGRARKPVRGGTSLRASRVTHLDAIVRVGTAITFAATGERLRVAKIEDGQITFEKLP